MAAPDAKEFAAKYGKFIRLVQLGTGLNFRVVWTWVASEGGPVDNPLNIGPGNHYGNYAKAAAATVALLRGKNAKAYGYSAITGSIGKDDGKQLQAIAASKWEGSHYANGTKLKSAYEAWFPKDSKPSFWGWVGGVVTDPGQAITDAGSWYKGALGSILSASLWIRVLMVILGAIALVGALVLFTKELGAKGMIPE